ncbi:hypothetical protein KFL_000190640 [Klebsormidium nitens]|uniref:Uncharacterized protein n=1 Tax=Klebsormidium nitens TaxID=105231 RepID=A0A1Y1HQK7_KLENI|nr:hypothetical protein KFL_000190640 [Klebsormidium nitens]|eukprot:GAQ78847.1 hypothetical protein KFL_000190640 [Klebsormidium nitens]
MAVRAVMSTRALLFLCSLSLAAAVQVTDFLPLLPHPYNLQALQATSLGDPISILPKYVGSLIPGKEVAWNGSCFKSTTAFINLTEPVKNGSLGGGVVHVIVEGPKSYTCIDIYVFGTPYRLMWDWYFLGRHHTETVSEWHEGEREFVETRGLSVFLMPAGMLGTLKSMWDVFPLFANTGFGESANIAFLERRMGTPFVKRTPPLSPAINASDIRSGDFLALSKIRGRWGGFETLQKWVTGAYAGHTAVALRDDKDDLWVIEGGQPDEQGKEIIVSWKWDDWWQMNLKDPSDPHVALLPLRSDLRATFNETAAWEYVRSMLGRPYGFHNMIFSWIDTERDNYPTPMDAHLVASFITMWERIQPDYVANMWNEALNKRLGTDGLDLPEILVECVRRGMSFGALLALPEDDTWLYSDGPSVTCDVLVLMMYKRAGVFGELADKIMATEFQVRDTYMLKIYEEDETLLPSWCRGTDDPPFPYCQLLGKYRLDLPLFNTIAPYAHMNERCPSMAPLYDRPTGC